MRYARALEIGCAIGILTSDLGRRCDGLLAIEPVASALAEARARNADQPHIRFADMFVPQQWPEEPFDLVIVSEVLDYLGVGDIQRLAERVVGSLDPGGDTILVHWVGKKAARSDGGEASDIFIKAARPGLEPLHQERNRDYRLDVLRRR